MKGRDHKLIKIIPDILPIQHEDNAELDRTQMAGVPILKPLATIGWAADDGGHIDAARGQRGNSPSCAAVLPFPWP